MSLLSARSLRAGYKRLEVLHGVNFHVDAGELVAVLGPNGAGKSTLLGALARTVTTFSGELLVNDEPALQLRPSDLVRRGIALVPQEGNVFSDLSVNENLSLASTAAQVERRRRRASSSDHAVVYDRFPFLARRRNQPAALLSGGERQALAVSMGFLQRPRVMLLDEPTAGLAPIAAENLGAWIIELVSAGIGVVWVVEQDPEMVLSEASRAYLLDGGSVRFDGSAREIAGKGASLLFNAPKEPRREMPDAMYMASTGEPYSTERTVR